MSSCKGWGKKTSLKQEINTTFATLIEYVLINVCIIKDANTEKSCAFLFQIDVYRLKAPDAFGLLRYTKNVLQIISYIFS